MASAIADQELALREIVLSLLTATARSSKSSDEVERAIASALSVFHGAAAHFAGDFNRTRPQCGWDKLPAELKLGVVHWLPLSHCVKLLGVSHDMRALLLSDPSLWTTISTPPLSADSRAEFLETMIARSGNCPLDIVWTDPWDFRESFSPPPRDTILRALPRAKTLTLDVSYFVPSQGRFWASSALMVESLTFTFRNPLVMSHCTISPDIWAGHIVPALRELKLPTITIDGPPRSPFETVLSLQLNIAGTTTGIQWLWDWFPRLQKLVVYVCGNDAPLIPAPPASLRHVILHPAMNCTNPVRVLGGWEAHGVRLLELYGPYDALEACLQRLDPARPLCASFTPACRPGDPWRNATVVRAGDMMAAIWSDSPYDQRLQIHTPGLMDRVQILTLGAGVFITAFREDVAFPALRSLTVMGSGDFGPIMYDRRLTMRAPALQELIIDLASETSVIATLAVIPDLVYRIEHANRLRDIVVRLSDEFDRHSPAISDATTNLAPLASDVRIDCHPAAQCRQDPCFCSEIRA